MVSDSILASHLVEAEMAATTLRHRGFLRALRSEVGPLIIIGLILAVVYVAMAVRDLGYAAVPVLVLAVLPGCALFQIATWLDRVELKPIWLLIRCALWGAGPAFAVAAMVNGVVSYFLGTEVAVTISAPFIEEAMKALSLVWIMRRQRDQLHDPVDAAIYAICVGIGFGTMEDVLYYASSLQTNTSSLALAVVSRGLITPLAHPLFTLPTALGIAIVAPTPRTALAYAMLGYVCAVSVHALWNLFPPTWVFVIPGFVALTLWIFHSSQIEEQELEHAVSTASANGSLPLHAREMLGPGQCPRFREWLAAARDPEHPLYDRWHRRHLALVMANRPLAERIAQGDLSGHSTVEAVQEAACHLLRQELLRFQVQPMKPDIPTEGS